MQQKLKANGNDALFKIARLQQELDVIKEEIGYSEGNLEEELILLEQASAEDTADFLENNSL